MVTTPMTYFAAHHLGTQSSVMVTGSHNPPDYNGLKMVVDGTTLSGADIQDLRARIDAGRLATGAGGLRTADIAAAYVDRVADHMRLARPLKIAVDCGNGVAGAFAPTLFRRLGLRRHRDVLRRRRPLSEPPSGSVEAREPARSDRAAGARASTISASPSTATATASAW